ncbi:MAG: DUF6402 family protein [Bacteroidota bacterium]
MLYKEGFWSNWLKVNVQGLGFYIKDQFDFIDKKDAENPQELGFWRILGKNDVSVKRSPWDKDGFYEVNNKSYRDYRDDHKAHQEGYNFYLYSDIHFVDVDLTFELKDVP